MPNWHWLLDPLVLAVGGLTIAIVANIWCFFHHRQWRKKHPSEPMPVRMLVKNHLFASTILTICAMGILYAFLGLWSWTGSLLIALSIWIAPLSALMILYQVMIRKLPAADSEMAKKALTVDKIALALFMGSPIMLTWTLCVVLHARFVSIDWESVDQSIGWVFDDACDSVGDFFEECWRVITNIVVWLTNARYWFFSSLFAWFTGIEMRPNYRDYN